MIFNCINNIVVGPNMMRYCCLWSIYEYVFVVYCYIGTPMYGSACWTQYDPIAIYINIYIGNLKAGTVFLTWNERFAFHYAYVRD
jgi:hypothetical protein